MRGSTEINSRVSLVGTFTPVRAHCHPHHHRPVHILLKIRRERKTGKACNYHQRQGEIITYMGACQSLLGLTNTSTFATHTNGTENQKSYCRFCDKEIRQPDEDAPTSASEKGESGTTPNNDVYHVEESCPARDVSVTPIELPGPPSSLCSFQDDDSVYYEAYYNESSHLIRIDARTCQILGALDMPESWPEGRFRCGAAVAAIAAGTSNEEEEGLPSNACAFVYQSKGRGKALVFFDTTTMTATKTVEISAHCCECATSDGSTYVYFGTRQQHEREFVKVLKVCPSSCEIVSTLELRMAKPLIRQMVCDGVLLFAATTDRMDKGLVVQIATKNREGNGMKEGRRWKIPGKRNLVRSLHLYNGFIFVFETQG